MVRLKEGERIALLQAARERATSPANWLRSLALAHLSGLPQWNDAELQALREVFVELRRVGNNVNQIARALNVALLAGEVPLGEGQAAKEAAETIAYEVKRVGELVAGNIRYWGVSKPTDLLPQPGRDEKQRAPAFRRADRG